MWASDLHPSARTLGLVAALVASAQEGVYTGALGMFALRVVETTVAWPHPHEHLLYSVSPDCITHPERVRAFSNLIFKSGISAPVRTPRGRDIMAACGQLKSAAKKLSRAELDRLAEEKQALL